MRIIYTEPAEAEVDAAYEWLRTLGLDIADNWLVGLTRILENEATLQAAVTLRRPLAPDSRPDRLLYLLLYRTSGRRSSPWHVVYELLDDDKDGLKDTLQVVRIRHASSSNEAE